MSNQQTRITANISKAIWNAFNEFAHPEFGIRRDAMLSNWLDRLFFEKRSDLDEYPDFGEMVPANDSQWEDIVRNYRRTFNKHLKSVAIALRTETAKNLSDFCESKVINRDLFLESLIYRYLVADTKNKSVHEILQKENVQFVGHLDMIVGFATSWAGTDLQWETYHHFFGLQQTHGTLVPRDETFDPHYAHMDEEPPVWCRPFLFSENDAHQIALGKVPAEKILPSAVSYWLYIRAYQHHLNVASSPYNSPEFLLNKFKQQFPEILPPHVCQHLVAGIEARPRCSENAFHLLIDAYRFLSAKTGVKDRALEAHYDLYEEAYGRSGESIL